MNRICKYCYLLVSVSSKPLLHSPFSQNTDCKIIRTKEGKVRVAENTRDGRNDSNKAT